MSCASLDKNPSRPHCACAMTFTSLIVVRMEGGPKPHAWQKEAWLDMVAGHVKAYSPPGDAMGKGCCTH